MKIRIFTITWLCLALVLPVLAQQSYVTEKTRVHSHPRLLLLKGEERTLLRNIKKDPIWTEIHNTIISAADEVIDMPLSLEKKRGNEEFLAIAREDLRRLFFLGYAYRMTGKDKYVRRAEAEMLNVAKFADWHPQHFLDVGELTMGVAIAYDWMYDRLSAQSKDIIEKAIVKHALEESYSQNYWWITGSNNWNQVCHAGISYGALAVWEKYPELAVKVLNRAIENIRIPMAHYAPDGAYPEGVNYWNYGTMFNTFLISLLEKAFKTDFGLSEMPGYLKSAEYIAHMTTPSLKVFNYSDSGSGSGFQPTMFWMYSKLKDESILFNQSRIYQRDRESCIRRNKHAVAALIWGATAPMSQLKAPNTLSYKANGDNPVTAVRSSWTDTEAAYLGFKLGSPSVNHAHMDAGSFIYEQNGVMWAMDPGMENYDRIESAGVDLWGMNQNSQRWDVYRYHNLRHNTLTFNQQRQVMAGKAEIDGYIDNGGLTQTVSDLSKLYVGQVEKARRTVSLVDKRYAVIEDEITTGKNFTMLTWTLVTSANPTIVSDKVMMLEKDGKKVYMRVECPTDIRWRIVPAVSDFTYDSPNPGVTIVYFDTNLKLQEKQNIKVFLIPEENKEITYHSAF